MFLSTKGNKQMCFPVKDAKLCENIDVYILYHLCFIYVTRDKVKCGRIQSKCRLSLWDFKGIF